MRIDENFAIVADIHANRYALAQFLEYLDDHFPVEYILNLGDFLQIGPHPREVAEIVLEDSRFANILGNNEEILFNPETLPAGPGEMAHRDWTIKQLGEGLFEKMKKIPKTLELDILDRKTLLVHSRLDQGNSTPIVDLPLLYQGAPLQDFLGDYGTYKQVMFGHTHEQLLVTWRGQTFLNPGSLGFSGDRTAAFCLARVKPRGIFYEFVNLIYDRTNLARDYELNDVPDRKNIFPMFQLEE